VRLLVIGAGRGADQIIDAISPPIFKKYYPYEIVGFMDDNNPREPYWGGISSSEAKRRLDDGEFEMAVVSISTLIELRKNLFNNFRKRGIPFANVIHPTAYISPQAEIGCGNVILAQCHIGAYAQVGDNNFISAKCSIEHHNKVGSHNTFGPSIVTSSRVEIGDQCRFGTGIFMEPGVTIGDDCVVASDAVLPDGLVVLDKNIVKTTVNWLLRAL